MKISRLLPLIAVAAFLAASCKEGAQETEIAPPPAGETSTVTPAGGSDGGGVEQPAPPSGAAGEFVAPPASAPPVSGADEVLPLAPPKDSDGDGVPDDTDNCNATANANQVDADGDKIGDVCDDDTDGDGIANASDKCPLVSNADQADFDKNGVGDACENDKDGDKVADAGDNCPDVANADQKDNDKDGAGDFCDGDDDNDAKVDVSDNCPLTANPVQLDVDSNKVGDLCDPAVVWVKPGVVDPENDNNGSFDQPLPSVKAAVTMSKQADKAKKVFLLAGTIDEGQILLTEGVSLYGGYVLSGADLTSKTTSGKACNPLTMTCLSGEVDAKPVIAVEGSGSRIVRMRVEGKAVTGGDVVKVVSAKGGLEILQSVLVAGDATPLEGGLVRGLEVLPAVEGAIVKVSQNEIYAGTSTGKNSSVAAIFGVTPGNAPTAWFNLVVQNTKVEAQGGDEVYGVYLRAPVNNTKSKLTMTDSQVTAGAAVTKSVGVAIGDTEAFGKVFLERNRISATDSETAYGLVATKAQEVVLATNGIMIRNLAANASLTSGIAIGGAVSVQAWQNTVHISGTGPALRTLLLDGNKNVDVRNNILAGEASAIAGGVTINIGLKNFGPITNVFLSNNLTTANKTDVPPIVVYAENFDTGAQGGDDVTITVWDKVDATGDLQADPKFNSMTADEFDITTTSPAIDKGTNLNDAKPLWGDAWFSRDLGGASRPKGVGFDIGVYEVK